MTKYFITGGAGFLGINLTRYLLSLGQTVVSYDIAEEYPYPEKDDENLTILTGDIRDLDLLIKSACGSDVLIHAAAALPSYSEDEIYSTDIEGTRNVFQAAVANGISRVVHISSTAVYGIVHDNPIYESDLLHGIGPYGIAKIAAEDICLEYRENGMIVPILRPVTFVGPERLGIWALLYDWATEGRSFPVVGNGENRYQLLDVYDLCTAIYFCSTGDSVHVNDTFNLGSTEFGTMRDDWQSVLDAAGYGKKIRPFPKTPLIWSLRILDWFHLSPIYTWVYETCANDSFVSIEKAKRQLGWQPVYSNKDALLRNYAWYLAHQDEFKGKNGVSHRVPWKQGILGVVKRLF